MKDLTLYSFYELTDEVQKSVVSNNKSVIYNIAHKYLINDWSKYVRDIADAFGIDVTVSVTNVVIINSLYNFPDYFINMSAQEIKEFLESKLKLFKERNYVLTLEFEAAVEKYNKEPLILFFMKFFAKLSQAATSHLLRIGTHDEYIISYLLGYYPNRFIPSGSIFDADSFLANGDQVKIISH